MHGHGNPNRTPLATVAFARYESRAGATPPILLLHLEQRSMSSLSRPKIPESNLFPPRATKAGVQLREGVAGYYSLALAFRLRNNLRQDGSGTWAAI